MIAKPNNQPSSVSEFMRNIPENAFLSRINDLINFDDFRSMLDAYYKQSVRCAYDPVVLFKMLLFQRWYNLSDRRVVAECMNRISFRRFLNLDICDDLPDDTTLVRFRDRIGKNVF